MRRRPIWREHVVGVALDDGGEPLQLLAGRDLTRRLHRAEHPLGILGHALHRLGVLGVDHPELRFERRPGRSRSSRRSRRRGARAGRAPMAPIGPPRARSRAARRRSAGRRGGATTPSSNASMLGTTKHSVGRVAAGRCRRRAPARWAAGGRSGPARAARGTRSSSPACTPSSAGASRPIMLPIPAQARHAPACPAKLGRRRRWSSSSSSSSPTGCIASPSVAASASSTGRSATRWRSTHPFGADGARAWWRTSR